VLVADVCQHLIRLSGEVRHPLNPHQPAPMLQYANDTLILLSIDIHVVQRLKSLLDDFSRTTGLHINFSNSTIVLMNVAKSALPLMLVSLGCHREGFPQTYLGLPLLNVKLNLFAFAPLISKADRYIASSQASLLNHMGHVVLMNSVLDTLPIYAMSALQLPVGVLELIDALHRAFLWVEDKNTSGVKCLVAWHICYQPKSHGGLGLGTSVSRIGACSSTFFTNSTWQRLCPRLGGLGHMQTMSPG
jgi:hypothetical protein